MERTQFTFYESFRRALARIKKNADRALAYDAIADYALYGTEPDLEQLPDAAALAFDLIRPNLDASRRKATSGKMGGEKKQGRSKPEANEKQTGSEKEGENEKEKEEEIEKENECYTPKPPMEKPVRHKYGEYKNVLLTDEDLDKLKAEFPDWEARIERLSSYIAQSGKSYKNHLATIRNWAKNDRRERGMPDGKHEQIGEHFI